MNYTKIVKEEIHKYEETELINSNQLFLNKLSEIPEFTYYKILERMVKNNELVRISKGIYVIPKQTEFGLISNSEEKILSLYLENNNGLYKGLYLFNHLGLTTQLPKIIEIYSSNLDQETKRINNFRIQKINMKLNKENSHYIELLEVLENYYKIEDINHNKFISYLKKSVNSYNDINLKYVLKNKKYKKSTIAFLETILNKYGIKNSLNMYLNRTSKYKIPDIEISYEATQ